MPIRNAIASLAVRDLDAAVRWYERLFGRAADSRPIPELAEWKFAGGGWLQVYRGAERAGSGSVTLAVSSLEEQVAELRRCGLDAGEPVISETTTGGLCAGLCWKHFERTRSSGKRSLIILRVHHGQARSVADRP